VNILVRSKKKNLKKREERKSMTTAKKIHPTLLEESMSVCLRRMFERWS